MSDKRCYYEVLGVARDANKGAIRKAYKALALQYHPDRNKAADATDKFKEVTEAYGVLSDDEKRQRYDQFGHAGLQGGGGGFGGGEDLFSHIQDMFGDIFGGFGGGRQRGPARGRDMRVHQQLTLEEAVLGCKKDIELTTPVSCEPCSGTGAEPGTELSNCGTCGGAGQVSTGRGFIMFTQTCPACQGQGQVVKTPCSACEGAGWQDNTRKVTVSFPAGVDEGHRLRVSGQGMPGARGGPSGHLYVDVLLSPHDEFERDGVDLITRRTVSFPEATMGSSITVEMLDGSTEKVEVAPGTQPGAVITRRGKGAPQVNGRGRGALHVVVQVEVPTRLSRRAKKLMRQLADELQSNTKKTA